MNTIVVATANQGKLQAVRETLAAHGLRYGWDEEYNLLAVASESGVEATPLSDEAGILGCENRLAFVRNLHPDADAYIAMEGIVASVKGRSYIRGWTMIEHTSSGRIVTASGASVQVPTIIARLIANDEELNDAVRAHYPLGAKTSLNLRNIGVNGAFTGGEYGRYDSFFDGIRICLSLLANPRNWQPEST